MVYVVEMEGFQQQDVFQKTATILQKKLEKA